MLKCDYCERIFRSTIELKAHVNNHLGLRSYECDMCEKSYNNYSTLLKHIKNIHKNKIEKAFRCEFCERTFNYEKDLKNHVNLHKVTNQLHVKYAEKITIVVWIVI